MSGVCRWPPPGLGRKGNVCPQLLYFLEDDTLSLLEPRRHNSGLDQGVLVKRHRVPKSDLFKVRCGSPPGLTVPQGADREYWHWTDLNIGAQLHLYGRTITLTRSQSISHLSHPTFLQL